jgi:RNA methyltransferase, TrmH family
VITVEPLNIAKSELNLLRSLSQKKVREREKKFIVEGWKSLSEALDSDFRIEFVAITREYWGNPDYGSLVRDIQSRRIELKILTNVQLNQASDTVHAQGVLAVIVQRTRTLDEVLAKNPGLIVFADRIADPGNLGTIVRTCDWFGVDVLVLSEGCVDLYNEKVVRSTSGSIFHIPVVENAGTATALSQLKSRGFRITATAADVKTSYTDVSSRERNVIILGNEAGGIQAETRRLADKVVGIPRFGKAESLNVGIACGVILAHLRNQG